MFYMKMLDLTSTCPKQAAFDVAQNIITNRPGLATLAGNVPSTAVDSVRRTEVENLKSQKENAPKHVLWYSPMGWLGGICTTHA